MLYAVIMAGGSGTRLWPLSRQGCPKQALRLIGERTMFQHAVDRLAPLFTPDRIYVVASAPIVEVLQPQAPEIPAENFILEPEGRDSAPAAGLAAIHLLHKDPDAVMAMLTADHYIADTEQFRAALAASAEVASDGTIVTLGIQPTYPATGFGYIELGPAQMMVNGFRVYACARFTEKPNTAIATRFLEDGRHTWNSGMFIWRADRLLAEYAAQLPTLHAALSEIAASLGTDNVDRVLRDTWTRVPRISIDYGIMEHASRVSVIPVNFGWADIGSWAALLDVLPTDEQGNAMEGEFIALHTRRCLVRSSGRLVALIGTEDLIVVETPDVLLVCSKARAEEVRDVVKRLKAEGKEQYL